MASNKANEDLFDNKFFLSYAEAKEITMNFFENNMKEFSLKEDENFGMGFLLGYEDKTKLIYLSSDRGDLSFKFTIDNDEIYLLSFEPLLSKAEWFSRKNILFLLKTIQRYLNVKMNETILPNIKTTD